MAFYKRDLEKILLRYTKFPVIALIGPRQSGKTTLVRHAFPDHTFVNLDDLELLTLIQEDPKGFLRKYENKHGIILDEFQNYPLLLSYIKVIVDQKERPGYFILTGSQNFLMNEAITESLAGRVAILTLLPFSIHELQENKLLNSEHAEATIFKGSYPRLYVANVEPEELYPSYIRTYIERDVRQLINVTNILTFQKFLKLCAARIGQLVNFTELANACNISLATVQQWLALLEASYIIFLLRPHWTNFNKRITKTPKLYFYDTGLACSLLEISSEKNLLMNPFYGNLFECFIIADLYKQYYNAGRNAPLYFWRDRNGLLEIDCLIEGDGLLTPIEIKSSETYDSRYFNTLTKWSELAQQAVTLNYVVYGGNVSLTKKNGTLLAWHQASTLVKKLKNKD